MAIVSMRMRRTQLAWPVIVVAAALVLLSVLGTAVAARPFDGEVDGWVLAGGGGGGGEGSLPGGVVETLRRLYLQQLGGPGPSCGTNSPNNGCPP